MALVHQRCEEKAKGFSSNGRRLLRRGSLLCVDEAIHGPRPPALEEKAKGFSSNDRRIRRRAAAACFSGGTGITEAAVVTACQMPAVNAWAAFIRFGGDVPLGLSDPALHLPRPPGQPARMSEILFHYYRVNPTTWFYLSSLLAITVFFKFNRVWSVRNFDLAGLLLFAPGLLAVEYGGFKANIAAQQLGFVWLFVITGLFTVRMLCDSLMVRRPLLEPNLTSGGLAFLGLSLLVFLLANVLTSRPDRDDLAAATTAAKLESGDAEVDADQLARLGPGYPLLFLLPHISTQQIFATDTANPSGGDAADPPARIVHETTARGMAILSQLLIVSGMIVVGWRHFESAKLGIAAAVLYLLLPYTAIMTGRVDHALPGALLVWAIAAYRRPAVAGGLIGLAIGIIYYPVFLLPLWCSFYWERGVRRFVGGMTATLAALVVGLWFTSPSLAIFSEQLRQMFGWIFPSEVSLEGFWAFPAYDPVFRLPVLAAFLVMMATLAMWPSPKHLGTLMSCTTAVLLGSQFWKAHNGGLFLAWFLPLLLLVVFRPNLENRVALRVLDEDWFPSRRRQRDGLSDVA